MKKYIFLFCFVCFPLLTFADFDVMNVPVLTEHVTDFSNILSVEQKQNLEQISRNYENATPDKKQVFVVLFPNRNGKELLDIGLKIFRDSGIGQKATNNGILLLIATEEKKIRIITGY